jgi:hypothetical protein
MPWCKGCSARIHAYAFREIPKCMLTDRQATNMYIGASNLPAISGGRNANGVNGSGRGGAVLLEAMKGSGYVQRNGQYCHSIDIGGACHEVYWAADGRDKLFTHKCALYILHREEFSYPPYWKCL